MRMRKEVAAIVLAVMIFVSAFFGLPLVSAAYTVDEHFMPPDSDDLEPMCAMKAGMNGSFYMPNVALYELKIEKLFVTENLIGDQTGGVSPYPSIAWYPDGKIDMKDISALARRFGINEGQNGWEPMADLIPDREIDMADISKAAANFGRSGAYTNSIFLLMFDTGDVLAPGSNGSVVIPQYATSFSIIGLPDHPVGAMVVFTGPVSAPIAYSTTFHLGVPNDGNNDVHYYIMTKFYVPSALSGHNFYFIANANEGVEDLKLNAYPKACWGSQVNISLGILGGGYHLLEFEYVDIWDHGWLNFTIETASGQPAWLSRFRIYVPDYSNNTYEYNVEAWTIFSMEDEYYLKGYADDFINSVHTDGLLWDGWMWNLSSTETIWAWGDGFLYPFGRKDRDYSCSLSFTYGEIWESGLLDFEIISWTNQPDRIGQPKFHALANAFPSYYGPDYHVFIENATVYGGSKWNGTMAVSDRFFECRVRMKSNLTSYINGMPTGGWRQEVEIGLGVGWAELVLPKANNDLGVTVNFTLINSTEITDGEIIPPEGLWVYSLCNYSIDAYSYAGLDIMGIEFAGAENVESIINPGWTAAADYIGNVVMFVSTVFDFPLGAAVGLTLKGTALLIALTKFEGGQSLPSYTPTISEPHYYRVNATSDLEIHDWGPELYPNSLASIVFFRLNPNVGYTCGLTKVILRGLLTVTGPMILGGHWETHPISAVEITIYVPWFTW